MGLYLAVFDDLVELDGVEVGLYQDFKEFRDAVVTNLEPSGAGSLFPTLILHSDSDGEWSFGESGTLRIELIEISKKFRLLPPYALETNWKVSTAKQLGLKFDSLYDCFFDVDGEPLLERLIRLTALSEQKKLPISFY